MDRSTNLLPQYARNCAFQSSNPAGGQYFVRVPILFIHHTKADIYRIKNLYLVLLPWAKAGLNSLRNS